MTTTATFALLASTCTTDATAFQPTGIRLRGSRRLDATLWRGFWGEAKNDEPSAVDWSDLLKEPQEDIWGDLSSIDPCRSNSASNLVAADGNPTKVGQAFLDSGCKTNPWGGVGAMSSKSKEARTANAKEEVREEKRIAVGANSGGASAQSGSAGVSLRIATKDWANEVVWCSVGAEKVHPLQHLHVKGWNGHEDMWCLQPWHLKGRAQGVHARLDETYDLDLSRGVHTLYMLDLYGDGWHGGFWEMNQHGKTFAGGNTDGQVKGYGVRLQLNTQIDCWSEPNRDGHTYFIAAHGATRADCGGRSCTCSRGKLACDTSCTKRRDYRKLTTDTFGNDEKQIFVDALLFVHDSCTDLTTSDPRCGVFGETGEKWTFERMLRHHQEFFSHAHSTPKFLPWHRQYIRDLEQRLQLFHSCVTIPYWDWTQDSENPGNSHIFDTGKYIGDADNVGVAFATQESFKLPSGNVPGLPAACAAGVLCRGAGGVDWWSFADAGAVANILKENTYDGFRQTLEISEAHVAPHLYIGGHMRTGMSPADPFFFLHHTNIDRIWSVWQQDPKHLSTTSTVDSSQQLSPQWSQSLSQALGPKVFNVCYDAPLGSSSPQGASSGAGNCVKMSDLTNTNGHPTARGKELLAFGVPSLQEYFINQQKLYPHCA